VAGIRAFRDVGVCIGPGDGGSPVDHWRQSLPALDSQQLEMDDGVRRATSNTDTTLHHRERNTVQPMATRSRESRLGMRDCKPVQIPATSYLSLVISKSAFRVRSSALSKRCVLREQFHNDPSTGAARNSLFLSKSIASSSGPKENNGRCADHYHHQHQYQDGRQQHHQKRPACGRRVHLPYAHGGQVEPV
jgi:hypothetical protein